MVFKVNVFAEFRNIFFPDSREIFYIGGAEVLPPPLEAEEEFLAIQDLITGNSEEAKKKLMIQKIVILLRKLRKKKVLEQLEDCI